MSQFSHPSGHPTQGNRLPGAGTPTPVIHPEPEDVSAIGLIGDSEAAENKIKAIGVNTGASLRKERYARKPHSSNTGACRMRSFHGRLSSQGLEYLDNQVNEWLDSHPDVEVKFVTSTVGVFEGKMREPALILNLWY